MIERAATARALQPLSGTDHSRGIVCSKPFTALPTIYLLFPQQNPPRRDQVHQTPVLYLKSGGHSPILPNVATSQRPAGPRSNGFAPKTKLRNEATKPFHINEAAPQSHSNPFQSHFSKPFQPCSLPRTSLDHTKLRNEPITPYSSSKPSEADPATNPKRTQPACSTAVPSSFPITPPSAKRRMHEFLVWSTLHSGGQCVWNVWELQL